MRQWGSCTNETGRWEQRELYLLRFVISLDVQDAFLKAWMSFLLGLNICKDMPFPELSIGWLWQSHWKRSCLEDPVCTAVFERPLSLWRKLSEHLACETLCTKLVKDFLKLLVLLGFLWSGSSVLKWSQNTAMS